MSGDTEQEKRIKTILEKEFSPTTLKVEDTSGGCGAMYSIRVESALFDGKSLVTQHKMVKGAIADEIKTIHGLTVATKAIKT